MSDKAKPDSLYLTDEYISRLQILSETIKQGDQEKANDLIAELTTLRESALFQELGKLTREIHDSIKNFGSDDRVVELTHEDIPDAKERLSYIVTKTDEAAHRTMNDVESAMDIVDEFKNKSKHILQAWSTFRTGELSKAEFLQMSEDLDRFLASIDEESDKVKGKMTDIMMAQDYQDLTGQMIKQVITMVQEVEEKLVNLIAISGASLSEDKRQHVDGSMAHGPQLPTADKAEVATNQDEVDDLLASLGF
jgi:chemotaxis protein CheZ